MLVQVNDGTNGAPRVWLLTAGKVRLHIMDMVGEPAALLAEIAVAAELNLPPELHRVPAPLREVMSLLREHATPAGVALVFALADHLILAAGVTDPEELRVGLLAYALTEHEHPAGGVRLIQHLQFGAKGLAIVMAEHQAQGATLH